jgi:hypothetical protein
LPCGFAQCTKSRMRLVRLLRNLFNHCILRPRRQERLTSVNDGQPIPYLCRHRLTAPDRPLSAHTFERGSQRHGTQ